MIEIPVWTLPLMVILIFAAGTVFGAVLIAVWALRFAEYAPEPLRTHTDEQDAPKGPQADSGATRRENQ